MALDGDLELHVKTFGTVHDSRFPGPIKFAHVGIAHAGPGIEGMLKFYQTVLNMRLVYVYRYPHFAFHALSADDENHRIGLIHVPHKPAEAAQGRPVNRIEHTSWAWASVEDILRTCRHVHDELGIWPKTARFGGRDITIDYLDPDGNRCELLTQMDTQGQILLRVREELGPLGGIQEREWADTYGAFDMEKLCTLWETGQVPVGAFLQDGYLASLVESGAIATKNTSGPI